MLTFVIPQTAGPSTPCQLFVRINSGQLGLDDLEIVVRPSPCPSKSSSEIKSFHSSNLLTSTES